MDTTEVTTNDTATPEDAAYPIPVEGVDFLNIPTKVLAANPGNVRRDLKLKPSFLSSIKHRGVRVPLMVKRHPDGSLEVVMGGRRLAAAIKAGHPTVRCFVVDAGPKADEFLDMYTENVDREGLDAIEQMDALFKAHEAGASPTRIAKETGLKRDMVKQLVTGAPLTDAAKQIVETAPYEWDLTQLSALKEFDDDPAALDRIARQAQNGRFEHQIQYERAQREYAAEQERRLAELAEQGIEVMDDEWPDGAQYVADLLHEGRELTAEDHATCPGHRTYAEASDLNEVFHVCLDPEGNGHTQSERYQPPGATRLTMLLHDGEEITPEAHETCPGHRVTFPAYDMTNTIYMCLDPEGNGHTYRIGRPVESAVMNTPDEQSNTELERRRLVIAGNKRWMAAEAARRKWLTELIARKTAPREVIRWVTAQMMLRPEPLTKWASSPRPSLQAELLSQSANEIHGAEDVSRLLDGVTDKRIPLVQFAVIAAAYESIMDKQAWRTDNNVWQLSQRRNASVWLAFLASLGYTLSRIEQTVVDNVPYTGEEDRTEETDIEETAGAPVDASDDGPKPHDDQVTEPEPTNSTAGDAVVPSDADLPQPGHPDDEEPDPSRPDER